MLQQKVGRMSPQDKGLIFKLNMFNFMKNLLLHTYLLYSPVNGQNFTTVWCWSRISAVVQGRGVFFPPVKGEMITISGLRGHWHSLLQLLHSVIVAPSSQGQYANEWVWLCAITLWTLIFLDTNI